MSFFSFLFCAIIATLLVLLTIGIGGLVIISRNQAPPDQPAVTVRGQTYTPRSILARNMGSEADQTTAFPPHRVIGNIYYVGTETLAAFLITTPQGHILINSSLDTSVPLITAELTSKMLPHCRLEIKENDEHFSPAVLDDFIKTAMAGWF